MKNKLSVQMYISAYNNVKALLTLIPDLLPPIQPLTTRDLIERFDTGIRVAITLALNTASPKKAPLTKHKKWWRPDVLEPLRKKAHKARRELQRLATPDARAAYNSSRNEFGRAIKHEKENRWREYLSTLTHDTLFQAKKFVSGRQPSPIINTLISRSGKVCSSTSKKAQVLFKTTCIATAPCLLTDVPPISYPCNPQELIPLIPSHHFSTPYQKRCWWAHSTTAPR